MFGEELFYGIFVSDQVAQAFLNGISFAFTCVCVFEFIRFLYDWLRVKLIKK